ncbi:uncharacterized protein LOC124370148 [Homalodisca vitripennis]|uniref:uncharacterized protein LOC124370148 n=1 Tax=Homalodisca vitripennis TaxID=197043 RepID=UPI001EEA7F79|nr:uncharacterized protein LOC124370148 [Homalodisca vitripennis]
MAYFTSSYSAKVGCAVEPPPGCTIPAAASPPPLLDRTEPREVAKMLRRTANTALGPDGVKYGIWRRRDPSGHVLSAIYNICLAAGRFPPSWKVSSTVLIHKKGAPDEITNWRPIALSDTAGKLFCSELLAEARRRGGELCVAWLDLAIAFGSVPHSAVVAALRSAGLTEAQLALIKDLYEGSATTIRHSGGVTPAISFQAGVRQGCPLSPVLFNLVMEYLIRPVLALEGEHGVSLHGERVSVLAYADDLAIVARSEASLQALLDSASSAATWVGLRFKPEKSATLHVAGRTVRPTAFTIYGSPLRVLEDGETYDHLGVPTGMRGDQTPVATIARLEEETAKIFASGLAPWQKLDAVRTFIVPQLDFNLRTARIRKTSLKGLGSLMRAEGKRTLGLPSRASVELVELPPSWGGAGLLPISDQADLAAVGHAFRLLTSPDPRISRLALEGLAVSAGHRSADRVDVGRLVDYLNGDAAGNSNVTTTFSAARTARNRLSKRLPTLRWGWSEEGRTFQMTMPGTGRPITVDGRSRKSLASALRRALQLHGRATLAAKPDQGRVARVVTTCPTSNHMMRGGRHTRFADWRFIHRARLNTLPLNGCRRWGNEDRRCRRCGRYDETTAHVLCHCLPMMPVITRRHDAILELLTSEIRGHPQEETRLDKRVPFQELVPDVEVPEEVASCRPDIVTIDRRNKIVRVVDVTVPYEDGWQSVTTARERKVEKYAPVARLLSAGGYRTTVDAFVVGSLGAWDSANWTTLSRLGVDRRRGAALARRCVSEAIKWSRDIYVEHVTGIRQYVG